MLILVKEAETPKYTYWRESRNDDRIISVANKNSFRKSKQVKKTMLKTSKRACTGLNKSLDR